MKRLAKKKDYIVTGSIMGLIVLFVGLNVFLIFQSREDLVRSYYVKSKAQSQLFGENISSFVETIALMMISIQSHLESTNRSVDDFPKSAKRLIQSEFKFLPQIENVVFFDQTGNIGYSFKTYEGSLVPSFQEHRDAWLGVSTGNIRLKPNHTDIYFSRRIENKQSEFRGVLMTVFNPDFLKSRFDEFLDVEVDSIILIDRENRIVSIWSDVLEQIGSLVGSDVRQIDGLADLPQSLLEGGGVRVGDSLSFIVSSYQLPSLPYRILVSYNKERILEEWRHRSRMNIAVMFFLSIIAVGTVLFTMLQIQKRRAITHQLAEHKTTLEETVKKRTENLVMVNRQLEDEIMERQRFEEELETNLKEKEVLLQEVHHRVKNNMAVISSLLKLQASSSKDNALKQALAESINRVHSMSAIHEALYNSESLSHININEYTTHLAQSLIANYKINTEIDLNVNEGSVQVGVKQASPLGLVLNELITNSLKYAFSGRDRGTIQINIEKSADSIIITYSDDGIGVPDDFDINNSPTLGLKLVKTLVESQLSGVLKLNTGEVTLFLITFEHDDG